MLLTPLVFVLGLILSAARVRPWTAGRAVLTLLGSGLECDPDRRRLVAGSADPRLPGPGPG